MGGNTQTPGSSFATGVAQLNPVSVVGGSEIAIPPCTSYPGSQTGMSTVGGSNANFYRNIGGRAYISQVGLLIGTQSGNIQVGVYTSLGGRNAPSVRLAASGQIACPPPGFTTVPISPSPVLVDGNTYFAIGADNAVASYWTAGAQANVSIGGSGYAYYLTGGWVMPAVASIPATNGLYAGIILLFGIP